MRMREWMVATLGNVLLVTLALPLSGTAWAQQRPPADSGAVMEDLDRRFEEYERLHDAPTGAAGTRDIFIFLDENGDGLIDRPEWALRKMRIFSARDSNGDGVLQPHEIPAVGPQAFAEADTNADGVIDGLEFNQALFTRFEANRNTDAPMNFAEFEAFMARLSD